MASFVYALRETTSNNNVVAIDVDEDVETMQMTAIVSMKIHPRSSEGRIIMDSWITGMFGQVKMEYGALHGLVTYSLLSSEDGSVIVDGNFTRNYLLPCNNETLDLLLFENFFLARGKYQLLLIANNIRYNNGEIYVTLCDAPVEWNVQLFTQRSEDDLEKKIEN